MRFVNIYIYMNKKCLISYLLSKFTSNRLRLCPNYVKNVYNYISIFPRILIEAFLLFLNFLSIFEFLCFYALFSTVQLRVNCIQSYISNYYQCQSLLMILEQEVYSRELSTTFHLVFKTHLDIDCILWYKFCSIF